MTTIERGSATPEAVANEPRTISKQITDVLNSWKMENGKPAVLIQDILFLSNIMMVVSPAVPMLDRKAFDSFFSDLWTQKLRLGVNGEVKDVSAAERMNRKGGILFPVIKYGGEVLGTETRTTEITRIDNDHPAKNPETVVSNVRRESTTVIICPSPQIAELCWIKLRNSYGWFLPEEFRGTNWSDKHKTKVGISQGISEKQLELFRKTTPHV